MNSCVISEVWLDGETIFTYSELLQYKKGNFDPKQRLEAIEDNRIKETVIQMLSLDSNNRPSVVQILDNWYHVL